MSELPYVFLPSVTDEQELTDSQHLLNPASSLIFVGYILSTHLLI